MVYARYDLEKLSRNEIKEISVRPLGSLPARKSSAAMIDPDHGSCAQGWTGDEEATEVVVTTPEDEETGVGTEVEKCSLVGTHHEILRVHRGWVMASSTTSSPGLHPTTCSYQFLTDLGKHHLRASSSTASPEGANGT